MLIVELNSTVASDAIRRAILELTDAKPLFTDIREYMIEATRKRFMVGEAPDGSKWAPKRQSTLDHYKRLGYGSIDRLRPLVGPGRRLSREINGKGAEGLAGQAFSHGAVIGSALIYSAVMQEGAEKGAFGKDRRGHMVPWGRIPARVWLGISSQDEKAIVQIAEDRLGAALDR